jgi:hypothetical protein
VATIPRELGEVLGVSARPDTTLGRAPARPAVRRAVRVRSIPRELWMLRDADLDDRLARLCVWAR